MGTCCSSKIQDIQKRYGNIQIQKYFISKIQLQYLQSRRPTIEKELHQYVVAIEKNHLENISRKQNNVTRQFEVELERLRTQQQLVNESQMRHNMKIEEIVGLESVKKKFVELRSIVRNNIQKVQQKIISNIRLQLDMIEDGINRKMQPNLFRSETFMTTISQSEMEQLLLGFKERKKQETEEAEEQIEEKIRTKVDFERYKERFIQVVPQEQLLALSEAPQLKEQDIFMAKIESTSPVQKDCCWCLPDFF